jgi:hypothetical protein
MDLTPEQYARRYVGVIDRLYAGDRYGLIVADSGERVLFRRRSVMGNGHTWTPRVGEAVAFARLLDRRGLKAYRVRPLRFPTPAHGVV